MQPLVTNGVVSHYRLLCSPEDHNLPDEQKKHNVPFYKLQIQQGIAISDLSESTTYECRLWASNEAGEGPAAIVSLQPLGLDVPYYRSITDIIRIILTTCNYLIFVIIRITMFCVGFFHETRHEILVFFLIFHNSLKMLLLF